MALKAFALLSAAALAAALPGQKGDYADPVYNKPEYTHGEYQHISSAYGPTVVKPPSSSSTSSAAASASSAFVKGAAFDRITIIYLETTPYDDAVANADCQAMIQRGILLTNEYGVGTPSQPNYIAPASGDNFGLNSDSYIQVNQNVSTIVDLLEDRGVSWSDYNEGLPYSGFDGFSYNNPVEGPYERKHNLLQRFDSIRLSPSRQAKVKNLTMFYQDLNSQTFPQWSFVTPNLNNDGHNTDQTVSCAWTRNFTEGLLSNSYYNNNALIYVTWQADGLHPTGRNHVAGILMGSAIPSSLVGTTDGNFYNHYSDLATVEANWGLHHLGRWDVGANVWSFVASKTGDQVRQWDTSIAGDAFTNYYWNQSYGGVFSSDPTTTHTYVAPNTQLVRNGRTILPAIASLWGSSSYTGTRSSKTKRDGKGKYCIPKKKNRISATASTGYGPTGTAGQVTTTTSAAPSVTNGLPDYYRDIIELPDALHPPQGFAVSIGLNPPAPITTPITIYPYQTAA